MAALVSLFISFPYLRSVEFCLILLHLYAVSGGSVSLLQGSYEYYHYLQDAFNDSVMSDILYLVFVISCRVYMLSCGYVEFHNDRIKAV